jgi:arylsulfatase A-like enzyme
MKSAFVIALVIGLLGRGGQAAPNVLLIMADDLGFSDLGCYGGEIQTPTLDGLAANGLRYSQFYNTARCWPTRAALLTGYYPQQVGRDSVADIGRANRPKWAWLLPKYLKAQGYRSYHTGKWHIDGMPVAEGFDRSYYLKDQHRFFNPTLHHLDDKKLPPVKRGSGYYGTVNLTDHAIAFLKEHQAHHASSPFFAYVAYAAPHFPLHALPEDIKAVGDRYQAGWDVIRTERWARIQSLGILTGELSAVERNIGPPYHFPDALQKLGDGEVNRPVSWNDLTEKQKKFQRAKMTVHAAMIQCMDRQIGRILDQVRAMKALENTLVIFLSDNGASAEIMVRGDGHDPKAAPGSADSHLCLGPGWSNVSNTPFRRHKTWVHEGGAATPFIVHWPKGIQRKGQWCRNVGHVIDVVPTILELADVKPTNKPPESFAGRPLTATFVKDEAVPRTIWWSHQGNNALRSGDWKLVQAKGEPWELFDLSKDRTESKDLAASEPQRVAKLKAIWSGMVDEFRKIAPRGKKKAKKRSK